MNDKGKMISQTNWEKPNLTIFHELFILIGTT